MKILVLGAGGIGGYYGARIHQAGGDVTFLVRPARAARMAQSGLRVLSPFGDLHITPKVLTEKGDLANRFDVVILSCKAYDLDSALSAISSAVGTSTLVLPLLNGVAHLDVLDARFGKERVLGGSAYIAVTLTEEGEIKHLNQTHRLATNIRSQAAAAQFAPLAELLSAIGVDFQVPQNIEQEMWEKFVFLATLAGTTCSMRANIGTILRTHAGQPLILGMLEECLQIATICGYPPGAERLAYFQQQLTKQGSTDTSSMLRDIERGGPTEAEHIVGDMVRRAESASQPVPYLQFAYTHLQAYELSR